MVQEPKGKKTKMIKRDKLGRFVSTKKTSKKMTKKASAKKAPAKRTAKKTK